MGYDGWVMGITLAVFTVFVAVQAAVIAFVYGWLIQLEQRNVAGRAAQAVLIHNQAAKKIREGITPKRDKLMKQRRLLMALIYGQPWWRRWLARVFGPGRQVRELIKSIRSSIREIRDDEAEIDHYHIVLRGEIRRLRLQQPHLAESLEKMLA